jgi:hypothetical protein
VRWLYVAAALVALLMSAGLPPPFAGESAREEPPAPGPAARSADIALPMPRDAVAPPSSAPSAPFAPTVARGAAPAPRRGAAVASSAAANTTAPVPLPVTSLRVVHQHRLGSCRGQLVVSRDGVAYVPENEVDGKDGFRLKYTQFLDELGGDSLRITSNNRDYRFRVAASSTDDREQLQRLATAIARFR